MRTTASIAGLTIAAVFEIVRAAGPDLPTEPALWFALGLTGLLAVTIGAWDIPAQPAWRMWVGLVGVVAMFGLLMSTYRAAAWMLRDTFPLMSEGIVAAPITIGWMAVVVWRIWPTARR